jgi:hypothetical protein
MSIETKPWPSDQEPMIDYTELIGPVRKSLEAAFELKRIREGEIPYEGYSFTHSILASHDPVYNLTVEGQEYEAERDRDLIDTILSIAFSLGYEQGRRVQRLDWKAFLEDREWEVLRYTR